METLPIEIINEIISKVDPSDLYALNFVSKLYHTLSLNQIQSIKNAQEYRKAAFQGDFFKSYTC